MCTRLLHNLLIIKRIGLYFIVYSICTSTCYLHGIGAGKMADHIQFMTGYYPNRWLQFCWKFISPLLILVSLQSLLHNVTLHYITF